uniref:Serine aminopeptidase S33 domain-containing protein n=1 Tax=Rhodosorus marinus TaxID=101924 RepID=A0A7S3A3L3_9RHOD|mmetsp:Transcript_4344/g.18487  ORF Transcript_4344/g.18487 Transcript_4344/m.18487 type:complete len:391 (+) Transcript_4344:246-1418(+)
MSASCFVAAPEIAMAWGGFYESNAESQTGCTVVNCAENFYQGKNCLTCSSAADEVDGLFGEEDTVTIRHVEENVICSDGASLRYQLWDAKFPPFSKEFRGLVVILHDFSTDSGRACRNLVPRLVSEGFAVSAFDLRGHGRSSDRTDGFGKSSPLRRLFTGSRRIVVDGDDCWVQIQKWRSDVETIVRRAISDVEQRNPRVFLLGDGFGAAMAIDYMTSMQQGTREELNISGVAACGAVLGLKENISFHDVYKLLDRYGTAKVADAEYLIFPDEFENLSRDLRIGEMIKRDNLRLREANALLLKAAVRVVENANRASSEWGEIPLAFFHGTRDICAPVGAVEEFKELTGSSQVTLRKYTDAKHWLHHEVLPERRNFLDDLLEWLVTHHAVV